MDWGERPEPLIVKVKPELPAFMLVGESELMLGEGLLTIPPQDGKTAARASRIQIADDFVPGVILS